MDFVLLGGDRHHLGAAPGDGAHILVAAAIELHHLVLGGVQLLHGIGNLEIHYLGGFPEAHRMFGRLEDHATIGALALEHGGAVMQAMGQHMHLGVLPGHDLAIEPDPAVALVKGDGGHGLLLL